MDKIQVEKDVDLIYNFIEQVNGLGVFKKLDQLDIVRDAHTRIKTFIEEAPPENIGHAH